MQFAKLTSDVFEVARLTHPLFRSDLSLSISSLNAIIFASICLRVSLTMCSQTNFKASKGTLQKDARSFSSSTWEANMPLLLWLLGVPLVLVVVLWMLHVV